MLNIILASNRPEALHAFTETLASDPEVHLQCVTSGTEALEALSTSSPHLVVIDSYLSDTDPLGLIRKLLRVNAMVNTAVVSPLADEEFHEASEGLGVLGRLPVEPGSSDAAVLLQKLRNVTGNLVTD
jgi:DNA-binding NarL/FixJ family response regulator